MKLFTSKGALHLDGHKHPSQDNPVKTLSLKEVPVLYFPLLGGNGRPFTPLVKEGDKVKIGTRIAIREDMYVPLYSSVSGTVKANVTKLHPGLGRPCPHLVIENDFKEEYDEPLKTVSDDASREEVVSAIKEAGIVGLGGAGFPTWIKYNNVKDIEYVLINAVECEPFLTTDFVSTKDNAKAMLEGAMLLKRAADAKKVVIAIKVKKELAINAIKELLPEYPDVELRLVPDLYPMGWERTLIKTVFKRTYVKLPAEAHVVVNNAQTAIATYLALKEGKPITKRIITVSGDDDLISDPSNIEVPVGTPVELIFNKFDIKDEEMLVLNGGPMTSTALKSLDVVTQAQMGGFTLLKPQKRRTENCLRCGECTYTCPANLQPVEIYRAYNARDLERLEKLQVMKCVECGLCSYVCPSNIELTDTMKRAKALLRLKNAKK